MKRLTRMLFRRNAPKPDPDSIADKLRSIRDRGKSDPPMAPEDVTGVQTLALEQLEQAMREGSAQDRRAAKAMRDCQAGLDQCSIWPAAPADDPK